jgi:prepilin signal peptidase PulO-like enzyme (type II secretory pathway)
VVGGGIFWLIYVLSPSVSEQDKKSSGKKKSARTVDWKRQGKAALIEARGLVLGEKYSKWIGFGDVTLGLLLGLLLADPSLALLMIFLASLFGTLVAVPLILLKGKTIGHRLPFGPYLMLGAVTAKLWGSTLIAWYLGALLGPGL